MFENLANFSKLVRGAGQVMPRIQAMKERMATTEIEATSACGRVTVKLSGTGTLTRLDVCETFVQSGDKASMEAEIAATVNHAIRKAKQLHLEAVREVVGDLGIPGVDRILSELAE
jgi:nucleoid-associated protein EbfC